MMFPFENLKKYITSGNHRPHIVFFGTDEFSVGVLSELQKQNITPTFIVTMPDMPSGRKLLPTPTPVKIWGENHGIVVCQPIQINDEQFMYHLDHHIKDECQMEDINHYTWDIFLIASFGKILPKNLLGIPRYGVVNIHPSLLPKLRGSTPIQTALLEESETGISIMEVDEKMDHGPIYTKKKLEEKNIIMPYEEIEKKLAKLGASLFVSILPSLLSGDIMPKPQEHDKATFTKKIVKEDGIIDLSDDGETNYRKYCAFHRWPRSYFFEEKNEKKIRVIISDAEYKNGIFIIKKVIPEGRREITWKEFESGYKTNNKT